MNFMVRILSSVKKSLILAAFLTADYLLPCAAQTQQIQYGFNVRAPRDTENQCSAIEKVFSQWQKDGVNTKMIMLRLNGGTISQRTYPDSWTDDNIKRWASVQKQFGCPFIFTINFNDTPQNQFAFFTKLLQSGMQFAAIELGNECYLKKFSASAVPPDTAEVSNRTINMTPEKYIMLSNEYISVFDRENLPFIVQGAPEKESGVSQVWNTKITDAVNSKSFFTENIWISIHLYERDGNSSLDTAQINRLRSKIKSPVKIAVTESGVVPDASVKTTQDFIKQEKNLMQRIMNTLHSGDILLNQVLYSDSSASRAPVISPSGTETEKGKMIRHLFF